MGIASWINIPIDHGRSGVVYRVWDAVARLLAGTSIPGSWTIVDTSAGATPTWANDTDPPDGAWVVVQSESAWAGGAKLQVFFGYRATSGALAGFGTKAAGLYCAFSHDGGFDTAAHYFGASLADWRNGSLKTITGYTTAAAMCLFMNSGSSNRAGSIAVLTRTGTTVHYYSFGVFSVVPPTGLAEAKSRVVMYWGSPSTSWVDVNANNGAAVNTALSGLGLSKVVILGDYAQDREGGVRVEGALLACYDSTTGLHFGLLPDARRCSAADGDVSVDGTRWVWKGLSAPRDAMRDGSWV